MKSLKERFLSKIKKTDQCWIWFGAKYGNGYGTIRYGSKTIGAHRASFLIFKGSIPNRMLVMHSCDKPDCVNPDHLFLGTSKENTRDMINKNRSRFFWSETNGRKTHCSKGHEYNNNNTYLNPQGSRECRICKRNNKIKYRQEIRDLK